VHWTDQPDPYHFGVRARAVTFGHGQFVLAGNDGLTAVSTDGVLWFEQFVLSENLRAITYAAAHFIAVGNNGSVISSLDGEGWTINRCPASMNLRDVAATPDAILLIGSNGAIWRSGEIRPGLHARLRTGGLELTIEGLLPECRVQASTDLLTWTNLFIHTPSSPPTFLDSAASRMSSRFYRLVPP